MEKEQKDWTVLIQEERGECIEMFKTHANFGSNHGPIDGVGDKGLIELQSNG